MSIQILCPFFNQIVWGRFVCLLFLLLSYTSSLYILDINPLSDRWFANIFSYSVGCLPALLIVSFARPPLALIILIASQREGLGGAQFSR